MIADRESEMTPLYRGYDAARLDAQYNARASVPSFEAEYAKYVRASAAAQAAIPRRAGIVYDAASGQTLDFYPGKPDAPLFVWIHGGYWRALSAQDNAFAAAGPHARGFHVAVIDYALAPAVTLDEIVRQARAALAFLHRERGALGIGPQRFAVGGSSAGGHLAAMLLSDDWQAPLGLPADLIGVGLDLSGLHDLTPLRWTQVNDWMNFDDAMIARNSPMRLIPARSSAHLLASVGGRETDEFIRQTDDYVAAWRAAGHRATRLAMPDHNHFDIALSLREPEGALVEALVAAHEERVA
jgi:arylformamidase